MQSHFFALNDVSEYYQSDAEPDDQNDEVEVLAAEKQPKLITKACKEVFDGVLAPSRKDKENIRPVPAGKGVGPQPSPSPNRPGIGTCSHPSNESRPMQTSAKGPKGPTEFISTPMEVRQPRIINEPAPDVEMASVPPQRSNPGMEKPPAIRPKAPIRQSQVSAQIGETQVVSQILNAPVTLRIGEVLASSRELTDQLTELIKRKNTKPAAVSYALITQKDAGTLIHIPLRLEDKHIMAIIDTGSKLNVVNNRVIWGLTEAPIDPARKVVMNDANGGAGKLKGHIADVVLKCGNVETTANLYVGEKLPFDLLLDRPWQRNNLVSIDERTDGTYLIFKDGQNPDVTYELLVQDHPPRPQYPFDIHNAPDMNAMAFNVGMLTSDIGEVQRTWTFTSHEPEFESISSMSQNGSRIDPSPNIGHRVAAPPESTSIEQLLHLKQQLTYLGNKAHRQIEAHMVSAAQLAEELSRENSSGHPEPFGGPLSHTSQGGLFTKVFQNFLSYLIRRTERRMKNKYRQDIFRRSNIYGPHNLQTTNPEMSAPPHTQLPFPLTIPPNNVPPPLPADPAIFQVADS